MLSCHSCPQKPEPGAQYEQTACANCKMSAQSHESYSVYTDDPAGWDRNEEASEVHPAYAETDDDLKVYTGADFKKLARAFGDVTLRLVELKDTWPETFKIIVFKLKHPFLSYTQIAKQSGCTKQNVFYHLKRGCDLFPELSHALFVDTRFQLGYSAIKRKVEISENAKAAWFKGSDWILIDPAKNEIEVHNLLGWAREKFGDKEGIKFRRIMSVIKRSKMGLQKTHPRYFYHGWTVKIKGDV